MSFQYYKLIQGSYVFSEVTVTVLNFILYLFVRDLNFEYIVIVLCDQIVMSVDVLLLITRPNANKTDTLYPQ